MLVRLLALVAVLLMPFGMAPVSSAARHEHSASMNSHCPQQAPKQAGKAAFAECTMACSAALPATELPREHPLLINCMPVGPSTAKALQGLHPETATPPPKMS
jgi:hypothetical protein